MKEKKIIKAGKEIITVEVKTYRVVRDDMGVTQGENVCSICAAGVERKDYLCGCLACTHAVRWDNIGVHLELVDSNLSIYEKIN